MILIFRSCRTIRGGVEDALRSVFEAKKKNVNVFWGPSGGQFEKLCVCVYWFYGD